MIDFNTQRRLYAAEQFKDCFLSEIESILNDNGYKSIKERRELANEEEEAALMLDDVLDVIDEYFGSGGAAESEMTKQEKKIESEKLVSEFCSKCWEIYQNGIREK